ncbi:uncharacterized protein VTP21DRAFT_7090 [Calcarisporiella thermophila]|uniref:uncharacterized protein n=1 Tax=Calcarisporiella thermophila TaxID=911321 RepID=UPI0037421307
MYNAKKPYLLATLALLVLIALGTSSAAITGQRQGQQRQKSPPILPTLQPAVEPPISGRAKKKMSVTQTIHVPTKETGEPQISQVQELFQLEVLILGYVVSNVPNVSI